MKRWKNALSFFRSSPKVVGDFSFFLPPLSCFVILFPDSCNLYSVFWPVSCFFILIDCRQISWKGKGGRINTGIFVPANPGTRGAFTIIPIIPHIRCPELGLLGLTPPPGKQTNDNRQDKVSAQAPHNLHFPLLFLNSTGVGNRLHFCWPAKNRSHLLLS